LKRECGGRKRRFQRLTTCEQVLFGINLSGKTIAVTGTTNGIGIETARHLALAGAHVICLNRNKELSERKIEEVKKEKPNVDLSFIQCDLASLASVRAAAEELMEKYQKLDVLILNAGLMMPPSHTTVDGLATVFGVNHVGHFHLTTLLLPLLKSSVPARIVVVSSEGHAHTEINPRGSLEQKLALLMPEIEEHVGMKGGFTQYGRSKMCNVLFAMKLHRDLEGK
ncbi:hypothetical protein PFISCL1PPCAC_19078, partial [Pristionchus fissidentatus]